MRRRFTRSRRSFGRRPIRRRSFRRRGSAGRRRVSPINIGRRM